MSSQPEVKSAPARRDSVPQTTTPTVANAQGETLDRGQIDGKFNERIVQNTSETGDCYLVGGVDAILAKPNGQKVLQSKISVDQASGNAQVAYGNKTRNFNTQEAAHRNDLESEGGDIRLIEMAEEQKRREAGHRSTSPTNSGDILYDGKASHVFKNLGLKNVQEIGVTGKYDYNKFNDPNQAYAYRRGQNGLTGDPEGVSTADGEVKLKAYHQYAVLGSTENEVLFHNPSKPFDPNNPIGPHTIRVKKSELEKYPYWLDTGSLA